MRRVYNQFGKIPAPPAPRRPRPNRRATPPAVSFEEWARSLSDSRLEALCKMLERDLEAKPSDELREKLATARFVLQGRQFRTAGEEKIV